jgi:hypothetical protein
MTMVPTTRNLLHHDGVKSSRGRSCYHPGQYYVGIAAQLEDQSSNPSTRFPRPLATMVVDDDEAAAAGTRSSSSPGAAAAAGNDDEEGDCWLQLGLAAASSSASSSSSGDNNITAPDPGPAPPPPVEEGLYLLAYDNKRNASARPPPLFPLPLRSYHVDQSYGGDRGRYRPAAEASGSAMSAPLAPPPPFIRCSGGAAIRVVSPPRRTEAPGGLWLTLRAAPNQ